MKVALAPIVLFALLAGVVTAQQPNTFNASMQVNGVAGTPYPITSVSLPRGLAQNVVISSLAANAPFVLFGANSLTPSGWSVLGGQLLDVDINVGGFILLDGIVNPTVFNTGPTGSFNSTVVLPATTPIGTQAAFQALVADPTVPVYATRLPAATSQGCRWISQKPSRRPAARHAMSNAAAPGRRMARTFGIIQANVARVSAIHSRL